MDIKRSKLIKQCHADELEEAKAWDGTPQPRSGAGPFKLDWLGGGIFSEFLFEEKKHSRISTSWGDFFKYTRHAMNAGRNLVLLYKDPLTGKKCVILEEKVFRNLVERGSYEEIAKDKS